MNNFPCPRIINRQKLSQIDLFVSPEATQKSQTGLDHNFTLIFYLSQGLIIDEERFPEGRIVDRTQILQMCMANHLPTHPNHCIPQITPSRLCGDRQTRVNGTLSCRGNSLAPPPFTMLGARPPSIHTLAPLVRANTIIYTLPSPLSAN